MLIILSARPQLTGKENTDIKTLREVYNEHLYELAGFKKYWNEKLIEKTKSNETINFETIPELPNLTIKCRKKEQYEFLKDLKPYISGFQRGLVQLDCFSEEYKTVFRIVLDFNNERLEFDLESSVLLHDDTDIQAHIDRWKFFKDCFCNGQLEICDSKGVLLSIKNAFVPVNVDFRGTLQNIDNIIQTLTDKL